MMQYSAVPNSLGSFFFLTFLERAGYSTLLPMSYLTARPFWQNIWPQGGDDLYRRRSMAFVISKT